MTLATYQINLDEQLYSQADEVFASYGLSPAQAIKLFFNQVAFTKAIPLSFNYQQATTDEFIPNEATYQAILAGREEYKNGQLTRYQLDDFMQSLAELADEKA